MAMLQPMQHRTLSIQFPLTMWVQLEKLGRDEHSSIGRLVRIAVEEYLKRKGVVAEEEPKA